MTPIQHHISILQAYADYISKEAEQIGKMTETTILPAPEWQPSTNVPSDDTVCVIIDKDGARYFLSPINGHWPARVQWWLAIPKMP